MFDNSLDFLEKDDYRNSRPHPIGRPPKLTPVMIEQICDLLVQGKSIAKAAMLTGISESTIYRWLAQGKLVGAEAIYVELVDRVREATECSEFELLQNLRIAGSKPDHWRATAWMLERRFPEKYGRKTPNQSNGENNQSQSGLGGLTVVS